MEEPKEAKKGNTKTRFQRTRTGAESDVEKVLYASSRPKLFLQSYQELERYDTADAPSVDVEHPYPSGCWFQVYSEISTSLANRTGL